MLTIDEALNYLKLEKNDIPEAELEEIQELAKATESYLYNATGIVFAETNSLAKLFCRMLLCDWYDERGSVGTIKDGARGILTQLRYCYGGE